VINHLLVSGDALAFAQNIFESPTLWGLGILAGMTLML
jgi:hypothetical protein